MKTKKPRCLNCKSTNIVQRIAGDVYSSLSFAIPVTRFITETFFSGSGRKAEGYLCMTMFECMDCGYIHLFRSGEKQ